MNEHEGVNEAVDQNVSDQLKEIQRLNKEAVGSPSLNSVPTAPPTVQYAGFWRRFLAVIIDSILLGILFYFLRTIMPYGFYGYRGGYFAFQAIPWIINIIYFATMHRMSGQTLGKKVMGVKVIRYDGSLVTWPQSFGREIAKILSGLIIYLGYLWMLWEKERRTWHDLIAKTHVVKIRR